MARTLKSEEIKWPSRFGRLAVLVFGAWTLFVWGGRLRNLRNEPGGLGEVSQWSLWGSVIFCGLALVVLAAQFVGRDPLRQGSVAVLAAFTTVIWLIRAVDIVLGDHSIGFIVVHVVLAVVSIGLAVAATLQAQIGTQLRVPFGRWVSQ